LLKTGALIVSPADAVAVQPLMREAIFAFYANAATDADVEATASDAANALLLLALAIVIYANF